MKLDVTCRAFQDIGPNGTEVLALALGISSAAGWVENSIDLVIDQWKRETHFSLQPTKTHIEPSTFMGLIFQLYQLILFHPYWKQDVL